MLDAQGIRETAEHHARIAHFDIACDIDRLSESGRRIDPHLKTATPAEREGARGDGAFEPFACRAVWIVLAQSRELPTLFDKQRRVRQKARLRHSRCSALIEEKFERFTCTALEAREERRVDWCVVTANVQINLCAARDAVESTFDGHGNFRGFCGIRGVRRIDRPTSLSDDAFDDEIVALETNRAGDIDERIWKLFEGASAARKSQHAA